MVAKLNRFLKVLIRLLVKIKLELLYMYYYY